MRYLCTNCNYIYNEDLWQEDDWIKAWTKFENLWDSFVCPSCGELPEVFHEIKEEINYLWKEPRDALEAEHFINIDFIWKDNIKISIWKWISHPVWAEHRITSIWIYDEYWDLVYEEFYREDEEAVLEFDVSDLDDFEIRARCSIHWVWWLKIKR